MTSVHAWFPPYSDSPASVSPTSGPDQVISSALGSPHRQRRDRPREDAQLTVRVLDLAPELGEGVDVALRGLGGELGSHAASYETDDQPQPVRVHQRRHRRLLLHVDARVARW